MPRAHAGAAVNRDKRVDYLSIAMQKVLFLEHRMEESGDPRGHLAREVATLTWLIETARDSDPDIAAMIPQAEALADARFERSVANRPPRD